MSVVKNYSIPLVFFTIAFIVYAMSYRGEGSHWNYFVLLADAFWRGRFYLTANPPWLNELITLHGHFYVPYPPMPAIVLMPLVLFFGTGFPQPYISIFLGAVNVALADLVFEKLFPKNVSIWLAILYGFGTIQWYHAEVGSVWYIAHIVALFFTWLALLETLTKRRFFLIGLLIGFAFLSRLPSVFAILFPLIYCFDELFARIRPARFPYVIPNVKNLAFLGIGASLGMIAFLVYNYVRFGTMNNVAYNLIPGVLSEPWFRYGIENIRYIPDHLKDILFDMPRFRNQWPYFIPNIYAMAIWITTPAFFMILLAQWKNRLAIASAITIAFIAVVSLMHGSAGFTQFGFRFALDYYPFLLFLVGLGIRGRVRWYAIVLIIFSILINLWGVLMISVFNIWSF